MIRVLIADDHQLVIDGIKLMFSDETDIACIGEANDGLQALELAGKIRPELIILDINMPNLNGIETCRQIRRSFPEIKILALSMLKEVSLIKLILKNGADGYLLKNSGKEEILTAIRKIQTGEKYFSSEVAALVMESLTGAKVKNTENPFPKLSRREKQILQLIVDEYTTVEIAEKLFISFGTVETHRRNLLIKLGARNTAGLVRACFEYNLLDD